MDNPYNLTDEEYLRLWQEIQAYKPIDYDDIVPATLEEVEQIERDFDALPPRVKEEYRKQQYIGTDFDEFRKWWIEHHKE